MGTTAKSEVKALNTHMIVALVSLFLTGLVLVVLSIVFAIQIGTKESSGVIDNMFIELIVKVLLFGGLLIIVLAALESIGLMSRIKKFMDKIIALPLSNSTELESVSQSSSSLPSSGVGGGLRIIRPESAKVDAPSPTPQPSKTVSKPSVPPAISSPAPSTPVKTPKPSDDATLSMTFEEALQNILDRYNSEKVKPSFKGWENTLMMSFSDLGKSYLFQISGDQGISMSEGFDESAAVQVNLDSVTFIKMLTKQINPIKAYSSGGLEVKGEMKNMLKLRKLMF